MFTFYKQTNKLTDYYSFPLAIIKNINSIIIWDIISLKYRIKRHVYPYWEWWGPNVK